MDIESFPALKKWQELMEARPAVQKGKDVPEPSKLPKAGALDPAELEKLAEESKKWVQQGMKEDAAKTKAHEGT